MLHSSTSRCGVTEFSVCRCTGPPLKALPGPSKGGHREEEVQRFWGAHLELLPQLRGVALRLYPHHLLVGGLELAGGDAGLPTQTGLQDGVVDEDVLLLLGGRGDRDEPPELAGDGSPAAVPDTGSPLSVSC